MVVNNEFDRMWKEAVIAYTVQYFPVRTEENNRES
jgi:hypothetical protein